MSPPAHVRGVGPKVEVRGDLGERPLSVVEARLTTTGGRGDKRESEEPEWIPPPDPNAGGVGTEETSFEACHLVPDG